MTETSQTTLAAVVERLARGRDRLDRDFVHELGAWLHEWANRVELPIITRFALQNVLVTFHMRREVKLVVTGDLDSHPGEWTLSISEREFPFVPVTIHACPQPVRYDVCTLDYGRAGYRVQWEGNGGGDQSARPAAGSDMAGAGSGICLVESTHGTNGGIHNFCRVKCADGRVRNVEHFRVTAFFPP